MPNPNSFGNEIDLTSCYANYVNPDYSEVKYSSSVNNKISKEFNNDLENVETDAESTHDYAEIEEFCLKSNSFAENSTSSYENYNKIEETKILCITKYCSLGKRFEDFSNPILIKFASQSLRLDFPSHFD